MLAVIRGYANSNYRDNHVRSISSAIDNLKWLAMRVAEIDASSNFFDSDNYEQLRLAVDFVNDAIEIIDKASVPVRGVVKLRENYPRDIFQSLAKLMFQILLDASRVKGSRETTWGVQHNTAWEGMFDRLREPTPALKIVRARLVRLLYDQIVRMDKMSPNYMGIWVVGLVLNIEGLKPSSRQHSLPCVRSIHKCASRWVKRNYLKVRGEYPDVAEAMLIGSLDFDSETQRIRKTYAGWLGKEGTREYLELDK